MSPGRWRWIALLVTLFAGTLAPRAETSPVPRVGLDVTPIEATVGETLEVTLEIVLPAGANAQRPRPGHESGVFTIKELSWEGPEVVEEGVRWLWRGRLAAYETGTLELPAVAVRFSGPEGESVVRSEPVTITIRSVLPPDEEDPDLADLKKPASIAPDYRALRTSLLILGTLLILSAVAWWLHKRYAHKLAAVPPPDPFHRLPPHVWVYRELQRLLDRRLAEKGHVDQFFSELSHILKRYLGGRFRVELMECTTSEVPPALQEAGAPGLAGYAIRELLEQCDRVKFAGQAADPSACRSAVEESYRIVDATRPREGGGEQERGAA